jgi:hypothetical protein
MRFERFDDCSCAMSELTTSGEPYVRTPDSKRPGCALSACVQTITASSETGDGRPSTGIFRIPLLPVSSGRV